MNIYIPQLRNYTVQHKKQTKAYSLIVRLSIRVLELSHTFTCCGMPEFWMRVGGLLVLMCGLPYLQACWGMPVKFWEGDPPCIGRVGGGCPGWRIPQDQWLGDTCRFGCWASFSTCICSWASVLCLGCWAWEPVRAIGGPSPLGPGFICWKGNGWGPLGCRAELFSTTREPERNACNCSGLLLGL